MLRGKYITRGIRRAAVAAVAAAATLLPAAGAQAAYPGANGRIAFATGDGIATVRPDGSGLRRVSHGPDLAPAWSPDGRRIAFERRGDIWTMAADGSRQRRLTHAASSERHPTWSPDGTRIAFESDAGGGAAIASIGAAGGAPRLVAAGHDPEWSPAGGRIAYVSDELRDGDYPMGPRTSVWTVAPDGSGRRRVRLTSYAADPDWSPDGTRIAFDQGPALGADAWTSASGAGGLHALGAALPGSPLAATPGWSPDGRFVAYSVARDGGAGAMDWTIAVENVATGSVRELRAPVRQMLAPDWQPLAAPARAARRVVRHRRR